VAGEVQQQQVLASAIGEEALHLLGDRPGRLVDENAGVEAADLGVLERFGENGGVAGRGAQRAQGRVVVGAVRDNERTASTGRPTTSPTDRPEGSEPPSLVARLSLAIAQASP